MKEIWKDIKGYEGYYQISNLGRVKGLKRKVNSSNGEREIKETILNFTDNGNGYKIIGLCRYDKRINFYIHRLVADAFVDNPYNEKEINHIDYDKSNNRVDNLQWCNRKENIMHSLKNRPMFSNTKTNTNEKYISKRKRTGFFEVQVRKKYIGTYKTLKEAIKSRNIALQEFLNSLK